GQDEFLERVAECGGVGADALRGQVGRRRHRVAVEDGVGGAGPRVARPEAQRDDLLVVGVALDERLPAGRAAAIETGDGEVEGAPEEMHGAAFAAETRAEGLEDGLDPPEALPQGGRVRGLVSAVLLVVLEACGDGALLRLGADGDAYV